MAFFKPKEFNFLFPVIMGLLLFANIYDVNADNSSPSFKVSLDRAWHPFSYLDKNNQPQGLLIDYWRLIGEKLGQPVEFKLVDWQQSLEFVREGKVDVHGGLFQSAKRDVYLAFSDNLVPLSTRLFVSSRLDARNFSDLKNVVVGITRGGYEAEFVEKKFAFINLKYFNNNEDLVKAALEGEVLAFVADYPVGMYYLHKYGTPEQYRVVYTLYTLYLKTAVAKANKSKLNKINTVLASITEDEKDNIKQKWIRTEQVIPDWLITGLTLFVIGLLVLVGWVYAIVLKRQVRHKTRELQNKVDESTRLHNEIEELVKELRLQKDEAEQANIAKSRFLATASHDLRQPLHALSLFTWVLDDSIKDPENRKVVGQIRSSVNALLDLFNSLLDISKLEAGVMKVEKEAFLLNELLGRLANEYNPRAKEKNLRIHWADCHETVFSDQTLVEQVLRNYLSNAIRYTKSGEVSVTCEQDDESVTVSVTDTGIGITEEEQKNIFDEFYQLNNPERDRSKGLGLGLTIVQRTARLLGHPISVQSQPGKGSTFSITLRRSVVSVEDSQTESGGFEQPELKHSLILVIDDETSVLEGTRKLLERWGYKVITASDLESALVQLAQGQRKPDVIIADYRLADNKTGVDAVKVIHTQYGEGIPVLIITGDIASESMQEIQRSGFKMLQKPVAPGKLRVFLRRFQTEQN
ncbi:MAG: transporter substrate-binding domain-containing protein [Gammaproteobacteria bacterium]|nr:transporter substrate-binding domain-containing protein [Gammaproteobacteria bacterium]